MNYSPDFRVLKSEESQVEYIETACIGRCPKPYRIDAGHPDYHNVRSKLERGDRSVVFCYHKSLDQIA